MADHSSQPKGGPASVWVKERLLGQGRNHSPGVRMADLISQPRILPSPGLWVRINRYLLVKKAINGPQFWRVYTALVGWTLSTPMLYLLVEIVDPRRDTLAHIGARGGPTPGRLTVTIPRGQPWCDRTMKKKHFHHTMVRAESLV